MAACLCIQSTILFYHFCPSVCLSNAGAVSNQMDILSSFLTLWYGRHSSLHDPLRRYKISRGTPSQVALNTRGWKIFVNRPLSPKQYEIGP